MAYKIGLKGISIAKWCWVGNAVVDVGALWTAERDILIVQRRSEVIFKLDGW